MKRTTVKFARGKDADAKYITLLHNTNTVKKNIEKESNDRTSQVKDHEE